MSFASPHPLAQGMSVAKAFSEWTRLYNGLDFVMSLSFYLTALHFAAAGALSSYASLVRSDGEVCNQRVTTA